ncbi:MAG: MFS transporter [Candidatus Methanomethylicia archaeon]|nr:MFS transporter [Candidatus Methanomethylicia archaeon]
MRINSIIKYLILFEFIVLTASGLIVPIFPIFITKSIIDGSIAVVGFSSSLYLLSFSIVRLISAGIVDTKLNDKQKITFSITGTVMIGISYILYLASRFSWHIYLLQIINGIGTAFRYSPFMSLFTRYIDKGKESSEWGINAVATSLGQALTAAIGGILAEKYSFNIIFITTGTFVVLGSLTTIILYKEINKQYIELKSN